jgi:cobalt-zinc-cadmium efflux system outer membrane protein
MNLARVVSAPAQTAPAPPPTLDELLAIARRQNPEIQTARLGVDSAYGEQQIARGIPNPSLAVVPGNPFQYAAAEPVDIGPERLFRTRAAGRGKAAVDQDLQDVIRRISFAVRAGYYDLLLANALRTVAGEQLDIVRQLLAADSVRLTHGDIPARDVAKTELELARADAAYARTRANVNAAAVSLELLLGVVYPDTAFTVAGELRYEPASLAEDSVRLLALSGRPDFRAADQRVAQGRALQSLATAALFPTPTVSLVYQPSEPFASGSNYAVGVGFTLPLFYWNGGERTRARAGLEQAEVSRRRVAARVRAEAVTALDSVHAAAALAERYEGGLLAKARAVLETERYAYQGGAASLLDLLDAIREYADTRAEYYGAVHDYWVSLYAVDRAVGRDLVP